MDEVRRAAWKAAIKKLRLGEEVSTDQHYDLLRDGMLSEENRDAIEEAKLFLRYWLHGRNIEPLPWLGAVIANHWFELREWDLRWGLNQAEKALQAYISASDYDHWIALNEIATRLHEDGESFPDPLAKWAADVHRRLCDGTLRKPTRERGHKGGPPYAQEDRNGVFYEANSWLEHFGMTRLDDRVHVISQYVGDDESVVRKGLARWRNENWRRAPWPKLPVA